MKAKRQYRAGSTSVTMLDGSGGQVTESFNGKFRDECLNVSWFQNLWDARRKIAAWLLQYNQERPHSSLDYRTPNEFVQQWRAKQIQVMQT